MRGLGMSGALLGTNRPVWTNLVRGGLAILILAAVVAAINTATTWVDSPSVARWEPLTWEVSSWVGLACALWVPWWTAARAPADYLLSASWRMRLGFVGLHLAGVVAYCLLHVGIFVALREGVYGVMGETYSFGHGLLSEFRKDLLSYMLLLSLFWSVAMVRQNAAKEVRPVSFDIRDGARIIRVPLKDILAVTAAGNYVEFILSDRRRPLMRATLGAVEAQLGPVGFVKTHRSWLINPERMTRLEPARSGDWTVALDGDVQAPVSRRYPEALARLRN